MGYESKIVIVERCAFPSRVEEGKEIVYGSEIMRFDLCKMGDTRVDGKTFPKVFTHEIDFDIYINPDEGENHDEEYFRTDCYGEHCKWATVSDVLDWLNRAMVDSDLATYRRAIIFRDTLKAFKEQESSFDQLCVVHYGH